jgi:hypothetical protein
LWAIAAITWELEVEVVVGAAEVGEHGHAGVDAVLTPVGV